MGSAARGARRRAARAGIDLGVLPGPSPRELSHADDSVAFAAAWSQLAVADDTEYLRAQEEAVASVRRTLGDAAAAVSIAVYDKPTGGDVLDALVSNDSHPDRLEHYRRVRARLREYGGFVVLAYATADP